MAGLTYPGQAEQERLNSALQAAILSRDTDAVNRITREMLHGSPGQMPPMTQPPQPTPPQPTGYGQGFMASGRALMRDAGELFGIGSAEGAELPPPATDPRRAELEQLLAEEEALLSELEAQQKQAAPPPATSPGLGLYDIAEQARGTVQSTVPQIADVPGAIGAAGRFMTEDFPEAMGPYVRTGSRGITRVPESMIPQPSLGDYAQVGTDLALTAAGSGLARGASHLASEAGKWFGRGAQFRGAATDTMRAVQTADKVLGGPPRYVPEGAPKATTFWQEVVKPSLTGGTIAGATGLGVDYLDPNQLASGRGGEFTDNIIAGAAGTALGGRALRQQLTEIMIRNPNYRNLMMRPSPANRSAAVGALIGLLLSRGIQAAPDVVTGAVDDAAALARDVMQTQAATRQP